MVTGLPVKAPNFTTGVPHGGGKCLPGEMNNSLRRRACLVFAVWLASFGFATAAAADPVRLPGASTLVGATSGVGCQIALPDQDCLRPGVSADFDIDTSLSDSTRLVIDMSAAATTFGPVASVLGQTEGRKGVAIGSAAAEVDYSLSLTPVGPGLVLKVFQIPVTLTANVFASASGSAGAQADVSAIGLPGSVMELVCPAGANPLSCSNFSSPTNSFSGLVGPNQVISVVVRAFGGGNGDGSFQATADPILSIDDALIPGTAFNFRDAFGVNPSSWTDR